MKTLSTLYDNWDIDFYVRLNFTSVEEIVDALGGITVNSEIEFYTSPDTSDEKFHFVEGPNKLNGKAALAFCREDSLWQQVITSVDRIRCLLLKR